jgi:uncharacterized protein YhaN
MPRKRTAHQHLDDHRQRVADEGIKFRELQETQARAKAELERIGDTIAAAYASEDEDTIRKAREAKEQAMARVEDLEHRVAGAELRAQRARQELDAFMAENAGALLEEREDAAREVAAELTAAVAATIRAHRTYVAERQHVDQLVAQAPGASPRYDGVSTGYPMEAELKALERSFREHPEAEVRVQGGAGSCTARTSTRSTAVTRAATRRRRRRDRPSAGMRALQEGRSHPPPENHWLRAPALLGESLAREVTSLTSASSSAPSRRPRRRKAPPRPRKPRQPRQRNMRRPCKLQRPR